jgi:hypothetical protein
MNIVRNCPGCGSPNIRGSLILEDSQYVQIIYCDDCPYTNHREIGSAEEVHEEEPEDDE